MTKIGALHGTRTRNFWVETRYVTINTSNALNWSRHRGSNSAVLPYESWSFTIELSRKFGTPGWARTSHLSVISRVLFLR